MVYERRWREARAAFDEVLRRAPDDSYALAGRALLYIAEGKLPEAFSNAWEGWSRNPLAAPLNFLPCWVEYLDGNYDEALELVGEARARGECGAILAVVEALALTQSGPLKANCSRIEEIAAAFPQNRVLQGVLGYSYALTGHPGKAWGLLGGLMQLSERKKRSHSYPFALVLLGLGEKQEACTWLERSYAEGSLWSLGFGSDPLLLALRGDPDFQSLVRRIGPAQGCRDPYVAEAPTGATAHPAEDFDDPLVEGGEREHALNFSGVSADTRIESSRGAA
jgi:tetratricopeptide (TPR) repeat protein